MSPPPAQTREHSGSVLTIEQRVDLFPDSPLPEFDTAGGRAYAARMHGETEANLVGIICSSAFGPRFDAMTSLRTIDNASVLRLREFGLLHWPAHNAHYYALAYERPLAQRYWQSLHETHTPMSEDALNHQLVMPLAHALLEFHRAGVMHGGIRPTNIFWREGGATPPQFGECLSAPAGLEQPVLFETIERGMCMPSGRGAGQFHDDCYAFGVTLALIMLGCNPLRDCEDQAILQAKMEQGSFNALIGTQRLAASHVELLRGLLADDPRMRWAANDLEQWLNGRRLPPKSGDMERRASRHISFAGKEFWQLRPLAVAMAGNVPEAATIIENDTLMKWLQRSYGDEERAKSVDEALALLKEGGKSAHHEEQLVARVCIALDPAAPIRYRGISVLPGGIASLLVEAAQNGTHAQVLSEIISHQLVTFWVNHQKDIKTDLVPLAQQFERMRGMIEKTSYGNGLERAVYELNPALPCLSPMVKAYYITQTRRILPALESVANAPNRPAEPMDRHLAAFLVARDKCSEALFSSMSATAAPIRRGLAMLTLFSDMQYRYGPQQLPGLSSWLYPLVEPTISRFLSKPFQEKVRRETKTAMKEGSLSKLMRLVDDPARIEHDENDFLAARRMYVDVQAEMSALESQLQNRNQLALDFGRPIASVLASLLSIAFIAITLARAFLPSLW